MAWRDGWRGMQFSQDLTCIATSAAADVGTCGGQFFVRLQPTTFLLPLPSALPTTCASFPFEYMPFTGMLPNRRRGRPLSLMSVDTLTFHWLAGVAPTLCSNRGPKSISSPAQLS